MEEGIQARECTKCGATEHRGISMTDHSWDAGTVVVPTAPSGSAVAVPASARRVRVTGCTAVDVCLVADGAAGAWQNLDRSGTHVHDVAGGLAVLAGLLSVAVGVDVAYSGLESGFQQLAVPAFQLVVLVLAVGVLVSARREREPAVA